MFVSGLAFVAVTGSVRYLGTDLPAAQSAFLRFAIGTLLMAPVLMRIIRVGLPKGSLPLFAARGALHSVATVLWFYAMARLPVAEVTVIGYLNPVVVTLGAALLLGERLAARRLTAIAVALVGALIVLRPGLREVSTGHLAQLSAALFFGLSYLVVKRLSTLASATEIVAMMSLTVAIGQFVPAMIVWVPPNATQIAILVLVTLLATAGHYCMTRAIAAAPLAVTQPVVFLQLVWATLLGSLVFGETVDIYVLIGGAMIIGAISYMTWREAKVRPSEITPPPQATKI
ncbi:MAG: DMT family transporter [Rhodobacteraceae bacterium]|nr:DMT family transporter [Paracoccaceae bacterium]